MCDIFKMEQGKIYSVFGAILSCLLNESSLRPSVRFLVEDSTRCARIRKESKKFYRKYQQKILKNISLLSFSLNS